MTTKTQKIVEIARSFSQKVSNPKNQYENCDFFASFKAEVPEDEAIKKSEELFKLARKEVEKSIKKYQEVSFEKTDKDWDEIQQKLADEQSQLRDVNLEIAESEQEDNKGQN